MILCSMKIKMCCGCGAETEEAKLELCQAGREGMACVALTTNLV